MWHGKSVFLNMPLLQLGKVRLLLLFVTCHPELRGVGKGCIFRAPHHELPSLLTVTHGVCEHACVRRQMHPTCKQRYHVLLLQRRGCSVVGWLLHMASRAGCWLYPPGVLGLRRGEEWGRLSSVCITTARLTTSQVRPSNVCSLFQDSGLGRECMHGHVLAVVWPGGVGVGVAPGSMLAGALGSKHTTSLQRFVWVWWRGLSLSGVRALVALAAGGRRVLVQQSVQQATPEWQRLHACSCSAWRVGGAEATAHDVTGRCCLPARLRCAVSTLCCWHASGRITYTHLPDGFGCVSC